MSSPQAFLNQFRILLQNAGVRFALTSGQACVYYGIQQTTKDSDRIIEPRDVIAFCNLLDDLDASGRFRVSFRPICGAPIAEDFLRNGWTSHIEIIDPDADRHHLDFFGKPPRVQFLEYDPIDPGYASRFIVAQMKKTDREKDWPFVFALGKQSIAEGDLRGVLHGQDAEWLVTQWSLVPKKQRDEFCHQRPLLSLIDTQPEKLRRALMIEKQLWQSVNKLRYNSFQTAWKDFFRQWRRETEFQWPLEQCFAEQRKCLTTAAAAYGLCKEPLTEAIKQAAFVEARRDVAEIFAASEDELNQIVTPIEVMLP